MTWKIGERPSGDTDSTFVTDRPGLYSPQGYYSSETTTYISNARWKGESRVPKVRVTFNRLKRQVVFPGS